MPGGKNVKSIQLVLDFHSGVPIYLQIVEQIEALVANGGLLPGDQLPTVRQMASELRVNFNTVARAYRMLDEARLISTQQGRGTYLLDLPAGELATKIKEATLEEKIKKALEKIVEEGYKEEEILLELKKIINTQDIHTVSKNSTSEEE